MAYPTSYRTTAPAPAPSGASPGHLVLLWGFRVLATLQAILFVLQPISIGAFLQGSFEAFPMHSIVGSVLVPITMLVGALGAVLALVARKWWLLAGSFLLVVATMAQVALGYTRLLSVHVPLGVLLVGLGLWLAIWSWTRSAATKGAAR